MGAGEQNEKVVQKATSNFQSSETGKMPSKRSWKRSKFGWDRRERKDHEFNFGL